MKNAKLQSSEGDDSRKAMETVWPPALTKQPKPNETTARKKGRSFLTKSSSLDALLGFVTGAVSLLAFGALPTFAGAFIDARIEALLPVGKAREVWGSDLPILIWFMLVVISEVLMAVRLRSRYSLLATAFGVGVALATILVSSSALLHPLDLPTP